MRSAGKDLLAVATVKEAQLLLPVGWIVSGVDIEQDLAAFSYLWTADADKPIEQGLPQTENLASGKAHSPSG